MKAASTPTRTRPDSCSGEARAIPERAHGARITFPVERPVSRTGRILIASLVVIAASAAMAGDDASGPVRYGVDLSAPFTRYEMTDRDRAWRDSLIANLRYDGKVVHFVRTSLELQVDDVVEVGSVYRAVELPDRFYVVSGDTMLEIGARWPFNPGVGGFSMHAPKSRDFIVCLNCEGGGVPHLSGTEVLEGRVTWGGHERSRFPRDDGSANGSR